MGGDSVTDHRDYWLGIALSQAIEAMKRSQEAHAKHRRGEMTRSELAKVERETDAALKSWELELRRP